MASSIPTSSSIFPTEIYENIIDLIDDREYFKRISTLKNCACTSHAWLPRSRIRLFQLLRLGWVSQAGLHKILDLWDRLPYLAHSVRELEIKHLVHWRNDNGVVPYAAHCVSIPVILAGKLPRLETLRIDNHIFGAETLAFPRKAIFGLATFTRLRTLDIRNVFFANYGEFHRIVAAFPALLTLRMQITSWRSPVGGIAQAVYPFQTRFPSIRRCEIAPIFPVSLSILYDIVDYQSPINLDCPSSRTIAGSTAGFSPISADHYRH